jgi:serine/threonine protein kinase
LKDPGYKKIIVDIEEAVDHLHNNGIVFADLRDSNILVIKNEDECHGILVDFVWAGEDCVDLYPAFMNANIKWPAGATDNEVLKKEHDVHVERQHLNDVLI